ncbi:MAG: EamA family transporter, partial [Candidatus Bipolaricaulota bacterium]|nr:EamA family transporter [Candidatus Bipolaricaulota bacterium]
SVPLFALLGLCQAVNFVAFFQAVARLEVGVAVSLFYVYPVLATVLAWAALREPFSLRRGLALASAAASALLVSGLGQGTGSLSLAGIA